MEGITRLLGAAVRSLLISKEGSDLKSTADEDPETIEISSDPPAISVRAIQFER